MKDMLTEAVEFDRNTIVISGFPGIGKSYLFENGKGLDILDSDSSSFSWISKGSRNPDFPNNYIDHIKNNIGKVDVILVSSHDVVRKALQENDIMYFLVYPDKSLKEEYIQKYINRGNNKEFIDMMTVNWDGFIDSIEKESYPFTYTLSSMENLASHLPEIERIFSRYIFLNKVLNIKIK